MAQLFLVEGPFESDYSLAIVNRHLAYGLIECGEDVILHQRDNTTAYPPSPEFLSQHPKLKSRFRDMVGMAIPAVHSRNIYPPFTDRMVGDLNAIHCYAWEESVFPAKYISDINRDVDLVTVTSGYVHRVLRNSGVGVPIKIIGNGVDHILVPAHEVALPYTGSEEFIFLHVSSCFPRKGCDVLVEAFCREFTLKDNVRLAIKTFPNPHNEIERIVEKVTREYPEHAPISLIFTPYDRHQMRFLYEHASCLVSPSRGEGFGLPVGESMLLGVPVVATMYSGQSEMCTSETCWPVNYKLERARTHMAQPDSYWAEPDVESLQEQMRNVYSVKDAVRSAKVAAARAHVQQRFTWRRVAMRHLEACRATVPRKLIIPKGTTPPDNTPEPLRLALVSTWNTRCGIAEYSRYLVNALEQDNTECYIFPDHSNQLTGPDGEDVLRCWTAAYSPDTRVEDYNLLVESIVQSKCHAVSIQFNFAFFVAHVLDHIIVQLKAAGLCVAITLHSIDGPNFAQLVAALSKADICIVHRRADLEALMDQQLRNVVLVEQGIIPVDGNRERNTHPAKSSREFVIGSFGFFLPPKGVYELILAFSLARRLNPHLRLKLLNATYPVNESKAYAQVCMKLISELNLGSSVEICTDFLEDCAILRELSSCDLLALPYVYSTESSSAAVRLPLASLTPVLCSDLPIFGELRGVVHWVRARNVFALATKLLQLSRDPHELHRYDEAQAAFVQDFSWKRVAPRFRELVQAQMADRHCMQQPPEEGDNPKPLRAPSRSVVAAGLSRQSA